MTKRTPVPWSIIILGIFFAALMGWSILKAARDSSSVIDSDYYRHGLRFNQTLLERQAAASLGWETRVSLDDSTLNVRLSDRDLKPVAGAHGELLLRACGNVTSRTLPLREQKPGHYTTELPSSVTGECTADVFFDRSGAHLQKRLLFTRR